MCDKSFLQVTLRGKGKGLGPFVPRAQPRPQPSNLPNNEVVLWQSKTLQWPAWLLSEDGNTARIRPFDKHSTLREVQSTTLSPFPKEAPGNIKNHDLKQAYKKAYAALRK